MVTAGIDVGSKNSKVVILKDGRVAARAIGSSGFEQSVVVRELLQQALKEAGLERGDVAHMSATGVGRNVLEFADSSVTDVTAAARGANLLYPGATTVVEVGAEESRGIKTDGKGRVLDSAVNERCAAGSGSFTESMARALGMSLTEFAQKSLESSVKIPMNAQCTVFAESEVVSLMHSGTEKKDISRAVHDAIASRVASMVRRVKLEGDVVLLGGLAYNPGFVRSLQDNLKVEELKIPEAPEFVDALGAAVVAAERAVAQPPPQSAPRERNGRCLSRRKSSGAGKRAALSTL
ncbi:MAG: CoA activase [Deltaproteobacteria bacterium]|nr:CoA activase [Deltaproteobacteria bacterium]